MISDVAALLAGHALAAFPDTPQCGEQDDRAVLLQENTDVDPRCMAAHEETGSPAKVVFVCCFAIVVLALGWMGFHRMTRSGMSGTKVRLLRMLLLCGNFAVCSWGTIVLNKTIVNDLKAPALVAALQMLMTATGELITERRKLTGTRLQCLKWSIIPLLFCGMLVSSLFTYQYFTLSSLMVIRHVTPWVTLPVEIIVMPLDRRPCVTDGMIRAMLLVLASTFLYWHKITISGVGCLLALLNMLLPIADRLAQRRLLRTHCKDLSVETCLFLNNSVGMIPCLILAFALGEISKVDLKSWLWSWTTVLILLSGFLGTCICYVALAVQREISAISFSVLQLVVRVAVVLFGVLVFLDPIDWPFQVIGLVLNFAGAFAYGWAQRPGQASKPGSRPGSPKNDGVKKTF